MAQHVAASYSLPQEDKEDPIALQIKRYHVAKGSTGFPPC
jgi:hypothetical protein